jgi:hypothetical protein
MGNEAAPDHPDIEQTGVHAEYADDAEEYNEGRHHCLRKPQKQHEHLDQRDFEDNHYGVAYQHAGHAAPEKPGMFRQVCGPGDILHQQRAHDDADDRIGRNAKAGRGNEAGLGGRVVGAFRSRDTFDRALALTFGRPGDLLLEHVAGETGNECASAGHKPRKKPSIAGEDLGQGWPALVRAGARHVCHADDGQG